MGLQLSASDVRLDMQNAPTIDDLHQIMTRAARIPLDTVKQYPHGHIFSDSSIVVLPKQADWPHRLDVGHPSMMFRAAAVKLLDSYLREAFRSQLAGEGLARPTACATSAPVES